MVPSLNRKAFKIKRYEKAYLCIWQPGSFYGM
jgi:hypothetical protein